MAKEIEIKLQMKKVPIDIFSNRENNINFIQQGYLIAFNKFEVRVRSKMAYRYKSVKSYGSKYYMTIKAGSGLIRHEFEFKIFKFVFKMLYWLSPYKITKNRYEIDEFSIIDEYFIKGYYKPHLVIFEREFDSIDSVQSFILPDNLKNLFSLDVTGDKCYKTQFLAKSLGFRMFSNNKKEIILKNY